VDVAAPDWIRGGKQGSRDFPPASLLTSVPKSPAERPLLTAAGLALDSSRTDSFPRKEGPVPLGRLSGGRWTWSAPALLLEESRGRFTLLVTAYQHLWRDRAQERLKIVVLLRDEFTTHCRVEKECLYPLVVKAEDPSVSKRIGEAELEHRVIEAMLQELSRTKSRPCWSEMLLKTLSIRFQRHGDQLQVHLFPLAGTMPVAMLDEDGSATTMRLPPGGDYDLLLPISIGRRHPA
jgi:Hemerythrin HHE cation binding domain